MAIFQLNILKNLSRLLVLSLAFLVLTLVFQSQSIVKADWPDCSDQNVVAHGLGSSQVIPIDATSHTFSFNSGNLAPDDNYYLVVSGDAQAGVASLDAPKPKAGESAYFTISSAQQEITATITDDPIRIGPGPGNYSGAFRFPNSDNPSDTQHVYIYSGNAAISGPVCKLGTYTLQNPNSFTCSSLKVYQNRTVAGEEKKCYAIQGAGCIDQTHPIFLEVDGVKQVGEPYSGSLYLDLEELFIYRSTQLVSPGKYQAEIGLSFWGLANHPLGSRNVSVYVPNNNNVETKVNGCGASFTVMPVCGDDQCQATPPDSDPDNGEESSFELCAQIVNTDLQAQCRACALSGEGGSEGQGGVWTAIGCIPRDPVSIAERFIALGLGVGGGVALIMTLAGGFILSTSQGDPQKANQAKEMITNSVIGLLFVIFSVVILQFIGVTILRIPGFGDDTEQVQ